MSKVNRRDDASMSKVNREGEQEGGMHPCQR